MVKLLDMDLCVAYHLRHMVKNFISKEEKTVAYLFKICR